MQSLRPTGKSQKSYSADDWKDILDDKGDSILFSANHNFLDVAYQLLRISYCFYICDPHRVSFKANQRGMVLAKLCYRLRCGTYQEGKTVIKIRLGLRH